MHAALDRDQAQDLLVTLCLRLGFCLPPKEQERIIRQPPLTVYDFTDAVFVAEGLDPAISDKNLVHGVRKVVTDAFARSAPPSENKT
jgi:hypothetical protein